VDNKQQLIINLLKFIYLNESNGAAERKVCASPTHHHQLNCSDINSICAR
jgi:hypothetical protein